MSGIHKSKEVYKYTRTSNGDKLIPVRGLYVSGLHTEPRYVDHVITVSNFTSNDVHITDYKETPVDISTEAFAVSGFGSSPIDVTLYTITSKEISSDAFAISGFASTQLDMQLFTSSEQTMSTDTFAITHFDSTPMTFDEYGQLHVNSSLEHVLTLNTYTSNDCSISQS